MVKYDYVKEYKKGDNMTLFWYSLKKFGPPIHSLASPTSLVVYVLGIWFVGCSLLPPLEGMLPPPHGEPLPPPPRGPLPPLSKGPPLPLLIGTVHPLISVYLHI
jgi:hypothetical protein